MIEAATRDVRDGHSLDRERARDVMREIVGGEAAQAEITAFLAALQAKGETAAEITGFAEAMREHVVPVTPTREPLGDLHGMPTMQVAQPARQLRCWPGAPVRSG